MIPNGGSYSISSIEHRALGMRFDAMLMTPASGKARVPVDPRMNAADRRPCAAIPIG